MWQIAHPWASYPLGMGGFSSGLRGKRPVLKKFKFIIIFSYVANRPRMGILPPGDGRFASGTGAKRPCYNNFKLLNIFLKYAPLSLYSYGISTRLNYVWLCISTLN